MEYSADETIVPHDDVKCCVVMPDGHLKPVTACWCKLYHIFGDVDQEDTETDNIENNEEIFCMHLSDDCLRTKFAGKGRIPNMVLKRILSKEIYGPGILFQKGKPVSEEDARKILEFRN